MIGATTTAPRLKVKAMWKKWLRHFILLPVLCLYLGLLVLGAMVDTVRPQRLDAPHHFANALLNSLSIYAGEDIWQGPEDADYKPKALCPSVVGHRRDGRRRFLYDHQEDCSNPPFRWRTDRFDWLIYRLLLRMKQGPPAPDDWGGNALYSNLADYFCHSPLLNNHDIAKVSLVSRRLFKSFATGKIAQRFTVEWYWNCDTNSREPQPWPSIRHIYPLHSRAVEGWRHS